jgi:NADH-quinone oxidoreductase subunit J
MRELFYVSAAVAVIATALVVTRRNAAHALLYLVLSLAAVAGMFYTLGAPLAAALEVIVYAGAIMVLFVFAVMVLALGREGEQQESQWLRPRTWLGPAALAAVLLGELIYVLASGAAAAGGTAAVVGPQEVGAAMFGPYALGVELASMLLLAGMVAAYHLARRSRPGEGEAER